MPTALTTRLLNRIRAIRERVGLLGASELFGVTPSPSGLGVGPLLMWLRPPRGRAVEDGTSTRLGVRLALWLAFRPKSPSPSGVIRSLCRGRLPRRYAVTVGQSGKSSEPKAMTSPLEVGCPLLVGRSSTRKSPLFRFLWWDRIRRL